MTHTTLKFSLSPAVCVKLCIVVASVALIVFIACLGKVIHSSQRDRFVVPDEKAVAAAMLEKKLCGLRRSTSIAVCVRCSRSRSANRGAAAIACSWR